MQLIFTRRFICSHLCDPIEATIIYSYIWHYIKQKYTAGENNDADIKPYNWQYIMLHRGNRHADAYTIWHHIFRDWLDVLDPVYPKCCKGCALGTLKSWLL